MSYCSFKMLKSKKAKWAFLRSKFQSARPQTRRPGSDQKVEQVHDGESGPSDTYVPVCIRFKGILHIILHQIGTIWIVESWGQYIMCWNICYVFRVPLMQRMLLLWKYPQNRLLGIRWLSGAEVYGRGGNCLNATPLQKQKTSTPILE